MSVACLLISSRGSGSMGTWFVASTHQVVLTEKGKNKHISEQLSTTIVALEHKTV